MLVNYLILWIMIMNGKIKSKELYNGLKKFINNENLL